MPKTPKQTDLDRLLAPVMFAVTLVWLALAGTGVHLIADSQSRYFYISMACLTGLAFVWAMYIVEFWLHKLAGGQQLRQHILYCLFPPLRLGGRDHTQGNSVWIPLIGWRKVSDELAADLELRLSYSMIAIALLVVPLLAVEFIFAEQIAEDSTFGLVVIAVQTLIWFAFAAEFSLMISLVSKKLPYMKSHWLDVAIICLPMIAFLRVFRLGSAARLTKLSKTARVFRLRGLIMRAWRAILILQIVDRILHRDPVKKIELLEEQIQEKLTEIEALQTEVARLKAEVASTQQDDGEFASTTEADSQQHATSGVNSPPGQDSSPGTNGEVRVPPNSQLRDQTTDN